MKKKKIQKREGIKMKEKLHLVNLLFLPFACKE